jgi:monoamine oxidase
MAGASAAHDLRRGGKSVLILEADERTGGRIWSDHRDGHTIDLGGGWIHFAEWNPLKGLADELGIRTKEFDLSSDWSAFFGPDRKRLSDEEFAAYALDFSIVLAAVKAFGAELQEQGLPDVSLAEGFEEVFKKLGITDTKKRAIEAMRALGIETPLGCESSKASLNYFDDDLNFGNYDFAVPDGYATIVERLLEKIPVELNSPVASITQTDAGVTIRTRDDRTFTCDQVIVTVSVGVLALKAVDGGITFDPPLPAEKQTALGHLEMGIEDKYWFRFDDPFWIKLIDEPRQNIFRLPPKEDPLAWIGFFDFTEVCKVPMLLSLQGDHLTVKLETASDEEVIASVMPALEWLFGAHARRPVSVRRSRWHHNPWTRGAYSHLKPGGTPRDRVTLGDPAGRVRFAGEATMRYFPDSVHGAYLSGRREAARILTPGHVPNELDAVIKEDVSREPRWLSSPLTRHDRQKQG